MRNEVYGNLKEKIIKDFQDKNNTYQYSDRLQVSVQKVLDDFVGSLHINKVFDYLKEFDDYDVETLDSGLYEKVLQNRGFCTFLRVLLYLLIEQDLYDDQDFNKLQFVEEVAGIKLK